MLNTANLVVAAVLKFGKLLGKADLHHTEADNLDFLLGLTVMIFIELLFIIFDIFLESYLLMIRLIPTVCEYLFIFRLFNQNLLFLHLPSERNRIISVVGGAIACRVLLAYFYMNKGLILAIIVLLLEITISVAFLFASIQQKRHFNYIAESELPQWEKDYFKEDVENFKVGFIQRRVIVYCSNSLQAFILNGTLWMASIVLEINFLRVPFGLKFDNFNLATRVIPHSLLLLTYLAICIKDKSYLNRDKTFTFELKERLSKPEV